MGSALAVREVSYYVGIPLGLDPKRACESLSFIVHCCAHQHSGIDGRKSKGFTSDGKQALFVIAASRHPKHIRDAHERKKGRPTGDIQDVGSASERLPECGKDMWGLCGRVAVARNRRPAWSNGALVGRLNVGFEVIESQVRRPLLPLHPTSNVCFNILVVSKMYVGVFASHLDKQ